MDEEYYIFPVGRFLVGRGKAFGLVDGGREYNNWLIVDHNKDCYGRFYDKNEALAHANALCEQERRIVDEQMEEVLTDNFNPK